MLSREDLLSLEDYTRNRKEFRNKVLTHKKDRRVAIGPNASMYFEDQLTMQYQIQEMLRVEKIFDPEGIQEELDAYNPLIPDGNNWKATFMIEFSDEEERRKALEKLIGIENKIWIQVRDFDKVWAIADEDLERQTEDKTSSVHFLRFQLTKEMISAVKSGAQINMGIDHENYNYQIAPIDQNIRDSLAADLAG